jgi:hypothetical protein
MLSKKWMSGMNIPESMSTLGTVARGGSWFREDGYMVGCILRF